MFKLCVFLALSVAACYGDTEQDTHLCGPVPSVRKVGYFEAQCEKLTCTFHEYNLLDGEVVNKERTAVFLDNFVKQYPVWSTAVEHAKAACLGSIDLKPQGVYRNCPIYDTMLCVFIRLIKHATPSQWSTTPECQRYRAFAAACPISPEDCFTHYSQIGTCNSRFAN